MKESRRFKWKWYIEQQLFNFYEIEFDFFSSSSLKRRVIKTDDYGGELVRMIEEGKRILNEIYSQLFSMIIEIQ